MAESFVVNSDIDGNAEYTLLVYAGIQGLLSAFSEELNNAT
jgi:hypothetical protein